MVQVDSAWNAGYYRGAHRSSITARNLNIASIVTGAIISMIFTVLGIAMHSNDDK